MPYKQSNTVLENALLFLSNDHETMAMAHLMRKATLSRCTDCGNEGIISEWRGGKWDNTSDEVG